MAKLIAKYQSIYLFLITLSIISFFIGYFYYQVQTPETKADIVATIDINKTLSTGFNNIPKRLKLSSKILINSFLILPVITNIAKSFTIPFEIGFLTNILRPYTFRFCFIYLNIYYIIPYLITLILIRISLCLSITIIKLIFTKNKKKLFPYLKRQILKYIIITIIFLTYEFLLSIFSYNINLYLMAIISSI